MPEYRRKEVKGNGGQKTPFVAVSLEKGKHFIGTLAEKAAGPTKVGKADKYIYRFNVQSGDMQVLIRNDKGDFDQATVKAGDLVTVFATKPLHEKYLKIAAQALVETVYNGKLKSPKSGNYYHDFTVNELEAA